VVDRLCAEKGYHSLNQYHNQLNPLAHYHSTGPEIWAQTEGKVTHVVAGIGTGGTISGVGRYLKEQDSSVRIIGVEPLGSWFQSIQSGSEQPKALPHLVEGVGTEKFVEAFHPQYIDHIYQVGDAESFTLTRKLCREFGLSVGGSTGSLYAAVLRLAEELDENSVVVFFVCDGGIRYISKVFSDSWMRSHDLPLEEKEELDFEHRRL
jgi:cystathionine beta-synthase